ncbi:MBL fold metallo-hydrolase [Desulfallas sp. Bu1-1]|uniref:MBL fold metallo-hydrolase n=1 Tax=Desulfallas sp. Bu1-1 TaxID=2787620 RepID=UPI00189E09B1|nr:MBL fold metallo-hydrolase [Desulfallas sp. Bu1-1]MBF7082429.1 MBL fold metallo-hydrolase [Desulfallas sp. Bu1-1]
MRLADHVTVLGNRHFYLYAVGSGPAVILEGGVSAVVPAVAKQAETAVSPGEVGHLVVMHAHFDHVCGIPGLRKIFPNARVAGSAEAGKVLRRSKIVARFFREDAAVTGAMREQGLLEGPPGPAAETMEIDREINDGEKWDLGQGVTLYFYHAPGHSPCSIMAYLPGGEVLFSSDSAGFPISDNRLFPIFFAGYGDYLKTIDRMRELPVQILAGAHEQIVRGREQVRRFLDLARAEAERLRETVVDARRRGLDVQATAGLLFEQYYTGNLLIYSEQNIRLCCEILTRRSLETECVS